MIFKWLLLGWLLLTFSFNKNFLVETVYLSNPYYLLTGCLGIQYFDSSLSKRSQLGYLRLPTPHCAALVWPTGRYATPLVTWYFPSNPCPGRHPKGDKYLKYVPLLIYLVWLQPAFSNSRLIFKHVKPKNVLLLVKSKTKKHNE